MNRMFRLAFVAGLGLALSGCAVAEVGGAVVGAGVTVAGAAVDTTTTVAGAAVNTTTTVVGAAAGAVTGSSDSDKDKKDKPN